MSPVEIQVGDAKWREKADFIIDPKEENGYLGSLTADQDAALREVREGFENAQPGETLSDRDLLRFCRGRDFNPKETLKMLLNTHAWRSSYKPGEQSLVDNRALFDDGVLLPHGLDRSGKPIIWVFAKPYSPKDHGKLIVAGLMRCMEDCIASIQGDVERVTLCLDLSGFGVGTIDMAGWWHAIQNLQNHFPERLGSVLLLNAPWVFSSVWNVIKGWLAPRTAMKIMFIGSDYQDKLKYFIEDRYIPTICGGTSAQTAQQFIKDLHGPAPEKKAQKGWFGWGRSGRAAVVKGDESLVLEEKTVEAVIDEIQAQALMSAQVVGEKEGEFLGD